MRCEFHIRWLCLVSAALLWGACAHDRVIEGHALNSGELTRIVRGTAATRNLPLRNGLPIELVEKSFVRNQFDSSVTAFVTPAALQTYQTLLKKLKLLPPEFAAESFATETVGNRVVGYYDSRSDTMRLVRREEPFGPAVAFAASLFGRDLAGEFLLAHELSHALADQNFDLNAYFTAVTHNADALLARQAFVEGDAQLVGLAFVAGRRLRRILFMDAGQPALKNPLDDWYQIPPVFRRAGLFIYLDGLRFANQVYDRAGTQGLNRVYARPPRSTEEVLHPAKYFAGDDPPIEVGFAGDPAELAGFLLVDENTLGELGVQALLIGPLGVCGAQVAAGGWGGDRFRLYQWPGDSGSAGFAWRSVWDSPDERQEFVDHLGLALAKTYGVEPEGSGERQAWRTSEGTFYLRNEGDRGALLLFAGR